MPRKQHKFHFIYKTVCLISNKYYIGMHSTKKLNDGYLGSGKVLMRSVNKYGRDNHKLEILEFIDTRIQLKNRERELVNEKLLQDPMNMNLQIGGGGGFVNEIHQLKCSTSGGRSFSKRLSEDPKFKEYFSKAASDSNKEKNRGFIKSPYDWSGKSHSTESKKKMSESQIGKHNGCKNSQFGTMWITNGSINKKIKKSDSIPISWKKGRKLK